MTTRKIRKNITKKKRTRGGGGVKRLRSNSQSSKKTKHQRQISPSPSVSSLSGYNSRDSKASPMELEDMTKEEFVDLTYMNHDGTKSGFALDITNAIASAVNIPVIASGGAGEKVHFKEVFEKTKASAALAASIFHFETIPIPELKQYLKTNNIAVR